ncbi:MAG: hypothetical protein WD851_10735 [Pirellulales bacterium]
MRNSHSSNHRARRIRFEALEPRHMLAFLAGDYDLSGTVDQSDYDTWRANFGNIGESPADGNGDTCCQCSGLCRVAGQLRENLS